MSLLPESTDRYIKFITFILKYWNSDVMQSATDNALGEIKDENSNELNDAKPQQLAEDLKNMGPTYVKLGQLLSTRPDLLPEPYLDALVTLQDDVEAIPYEEVQKIIEDELGVRISKLFESFDEQPLASASIGQVHKAVLNSGKTVAVKIQRPGTRKKFVDDLDTIKSMIDLAVKHSDIARRYALDDVLELRLILLNELDYTREAENLVLLGENMKSFSKIIIPQPVDNYCTSRVLTMDFIDGKKITKISGLEKTEKNFTPLVNDLVEGYLKQIVVDGLAHADPHPGNVHLTKNGKLALMDLGMVAKFNPTMQEQLLKLLIAISKRDGDQIAEILLYISNYEKDADTQGFKKNINRVVMNSRENTAKHMQTGKLLLQMNRVAADHNIKIAVELNILGKILLNMDQIVATLAPEYDFQEAVRKYVEKIMQKKMLQDLKPENMFNVLLESKKLTEEMPGRLNKIMERLASNEIEIKVDAIDKKDLQMVFKK